MTYLTGGSESNSRTAHDANSIHGSIQSHHIEKSARVLSAESTVIPSCRSLHNPATNRNHSHNYNPFQTLYFTDPIIWCALTCQSLATNNITVTLFGFQTRMISRSRIQLTRMPNRPIPPRKSHNLKSYYTYILCTRLKRWEKGISTTQVPRNFTPIHSFSFHSFSQLFPYHWSSDPPLRSFCQLFRLEWDAELTRNLS